MEIPAGVSFFYANNEPKSALARDLGDCRDNKGKLAKRVFTCYNRKFRGIPYYTKGIDVPMLCTRSPLAARAFSWASVRLRGWSHNARAEECEATIGFVLISNAS